MKKIILSLVISFSLLPSLSSGAPFVEAKVEEFLNGSARKKEETLPLFVTFKNKGLLTNGLSRAEKIQVLQNQTLENMQKLRKRFTSAQALGVEPLWIGNGAFLSLTASEIAQLRAIPEVHGIYWSRKPYKFNKSPTRAEFTTSRFTYGLSKIGVPELQRRYPHLTGRNIRVGILDTGIMANHPDLRGKLKVYRNFSPAADDSPKDEFGHGTHVAGTIAGGKSSGEAIGVAPEADLIVGRLFDRNGNSERDLILKSMQWMADPDGDPTTADFAQVVNSSWSDDDPYDTRDPQDEPFCQIINNWVSLGMIPVFSAGNTGPALGTINLPAGCPAAFSVGATEINDRSPWFSSSGPARWRNLNLMKPEVTAPGFNIKSAQNDGRYEEMSGTSMSAPHVTGAFAILLQAYPSQSALEIQRAMAEGAKDLGDIGQDPIFGYGRIDLMKSLEILEKLRDSQARLP